MNPRFLQWWAAHAPKGANNSVNALLIVSLIRASAMPLSLANLSRLMGGRPIASLRGIVDDLIEAGFLRSEPRHSTTPNHHRFFVYFLTPELTRYLNQP